jgi:hypothetical protein
LDHTANVRFPPKPAFNGEATFAPQSTLFTHVLNVSLRLVSWCEPPNRSDTRFCDSTEEVTVLKVSAGEFAQIFRVHGSELSDGGGRGNLRFLPMVDIVLQRDSLPSFIAKHCLLGM